MSAHTDAGIPLRQRDTQVSANWLDSSVEMVKLTKSIEDMSKRLESMERRITYMEQWVPRMQFLVDQHNKKSNGSFLKTDKIMQLVANECLPKRRAWERERTTEISIKTHSITIHAFTTLLNSDVGIPRNRYRRH